MKDQDTEELRQTLLREIWAGASAGLDAMMADEDAVRRAGPEELEDIARRYAQAGAQTEKGEEIP